MNVRHDGPAPARRPHGIALELVPDPDRLSLVTVFPVDLADTSAFHDWYEAVFEVWRDAWPGDPPWAGEAEMRDLFSTQEDSDRVLFVARTSEGVPAGAAEVELPKRDNLHVANVEISVRPPFRGLGIGRALLGRAGECAAERGRTVLHSNTYGRNASLETRDARFARAAGFACARTEVRRDLQLPLDDAWITTLQEASSKHAAGYELVSWQRRCPDHLVESHARLMTTLTADEPRGDLDVETEQFDAERIRRWERDLERVGRVLVCTGAVSTVTGELAAVTELGLPRPGDDLAMQFATVVAGVHRGHRLGLLVKLANLKLVAAHTPAPKRICTWNAQSNEHMIRVNDELGFDVVGQAFNWQKTLS